VGQLQNVALVNGVAFHSRFDVDQVGADEFGHRDRVDFKKITRKLCYSKDDRAMRAI